MQVVFCILYSGQRIFIFLRNVAELRIWKLRGRVWGQRAGRYKTFQGEQLGEGVKKRFYVEANGADASSEGQNCSYLATRSV